ncbi:MAG: hypothetical protein ACM3SU_08190 [Acidobacteriota bacterium]
MIDWIGYGWIAGEVSGPNTFFADLTIEVPRGDVVAAAAVTGFSVGIQQREPGSVAAYVREYARFRSATRIDVVDVPPDPTNNVMAITDCAYVRFRMTVFQGHAFSRGLVFRFAPKPPQPLMRAPKFAMTEHLIRAGGKVVGTHRVMALSRGSRLRLDALVHRAAAEAGRFLRVRPRDIEIVREKRRRAPEGGVPGALGIF